MRPIVSRNLYVISELKSPSVSLHLLLIVIITSLSSSISFSQSEIHQTDITTKPNWVTMMDSGTFSSEQVTASYNAYYQNHEFIKNIYTQDYKRYIRKNTRQAFETNSAISQLRSQQKKYVSSVKQEKSRTTSWSALGPFDVDLNSASVGSTPGLAHIYTVEKSLTNSNLLIAGAATAGAWKSTDNGNSWYALTNNLMVTEVKAVEIHASNENILFFGGNGHIYKSTNGGSSWNTTGNSTFQNKYHHINDIISDPNNPDILYAASNHGLYQSTDQGQNWQLRSSGKFWEIEIHPTNSQLVYAIKQEGNSTIFYKSNDTGTSFQKAGNGYPTAASGQEQLRTEIAVSPASPDKIVAIATGIANGGAGLFGIYESLDQGENWVFKCCGDGPGGKASLENTNLMAWQASGATNGGQYYYDLALAISNTNENVIYTGGINIWKSTDGGATFINNADYIYKKAKEKYVHADIQDIRIYGNEIWVATDGGIFMSNDNGVTFNKKMYGIVGTDFRGFGAGAKDGEVLIGGTYHNGTLIKENNTYEGGWLSTLSGDNTQGNVNPQNNLITYSDIGIMVLPGSRTSIPSVKSVSKKPNSSYYTGESSEYVFNPDNANQYYIGSGGAIYMTQDNGTNFTLLQNFGTGKVTKIEVSPVDPNYIYLVYYPSFTAHKKLYRSTDGGLNWSDISPNQSLFENNKLWIAWDITASSSTPDELWLARTPQKSSDANIDGYHIFKTSDGGASWTNLSTASLDGELITNIVHQKGTQGGVYIGTRRAVYYKNANMNAWEQYSSGQPLLTYSTNLVILYTQNRIINATHRGVYASALYETVQKEAAFIVDKTQGICANETFQFTNSSTGMSSNASYNWYFENGNPSVSEEANPTVTFSGVGSHNVRLEVIDGNETKTSVKNNLISILESCKTETEPGKAVSSSKNNYVVVPPLEILSNELSFSAWVKRVGNTNDNAGLIIHRKSGKSSGLSISSDGEVKYNWDNNIDPISTGLTIEREKWTHIAFSVSLNSISVFVNGIEKKFTGNYSAVQFDKEIVIGKDPSANIRYFNGYFDEAIFYDKAISVDEVRKGMNLVKYANLDPSIIHYYQFNSEQIIIKDIIGAKHASFYSTPSYVNSVCPVGKGISEVSLISSFGIQNFNQVMVEINIESGTCLGSEVGIAKLERTVEGANDTHNSDFVYIMNHFSDNEFIIKGELAISRAIENLDIVGLRVDSFKLYQLAQDALPAWGAAPINYGDTYEKENNNKVIFKVTEESNLEGKYLISYNEITASLAISDIVIDLEEYESGKVDVQWYVNLEDRFATSELQRSYDGKNFETITSVDHKDDVDTYNYIDLTANFGRNYYRLKVYYQDGSYDFSDMESIVVGRTANENFLHPNPVSNAGYVQIKDYQNAGGRILVFNMLGQLMISNNHLTNGKLDISSLASGSYVVMLKQKSTFRKQILIKN